MNEQNILGFAQLDSIKAKDPNFNGPITVKIFDFDNTLFRSPVPNEKMWGRSFYGCLVSDLKTGGLGWWQSLISMDPTIINVNDWIEETTEEVKKAMPVESEFKVMLTGRNTSFFDTIKGMLDSKGLQFNAYGLKPFVTKMSTLDFKFDFIKKTLEDLRTAGHHVSAVEMWEDRREHIGEFTEFLAGLKLPAFDIHHVSGGEACLPEAKEKVVVEVLKKAYLENNPNGSLPKVHYYGVVLDEESKNQVRSYLFNHEDIKKLGDHMTLVPPHRVNENSDVRTWAIENDGLEVELLINEIGETEDGKNWAFKVESKVPCLNSTPHITIQIAKDGRAKDSNNITEWHPIDKPFTVRGKVRAIYENFGSKRKLLSNNPKKKSLGEVLQERFPEKFSGRLSIFLSPVISTIKKNGWDLDRHEQEISKYIASLHS